MASFPTARMGIIPTGPRAKKVFSVAQTKKNRRGGCRPKEAESGGYPGRQGVPMQDGKLQIPEKRLWWRL